MNALARGDAAVPCLSPSMGTRMSSATNPAVSWIIRMRREPFNLRFIKRTPAFHDPSATGKLESGVLLKLLGLLKFERLARLAIR
jgi:hypothetical protein